MKKTAQVSIPEGGVGKAYRTPTDAQLKKVMKEYPDGFISELQRA